MREVFYRLQGSRNGQILLDVRMDVEFASHAFNKATDLIVAFGDTKQPVDLWTLARVEREVV